MLDAPCAQGSGALLPALRATRNPMPPACRQRLQHTGSATCKLLHAPACLACHEVCTHVQRLCQLLDVANLCGCSVAPPLAVTALFTAAGRVAAVVRSHTSRAGDTARTIVGVNAFIAISCRRMCTASCFVFYSFRNRLRPPTARDRPRDAFVSAARST